MAITSPTNGQSFTLPADVTIVADASDADGSVTNVSFFDGGTLLGGTNNAPYAITVGLALGSHALTAVATDNLGLSTTSVVVNVTGAANVPRNNRLAATSATDAAALAAAWTAFRPGWQAWNHVRTITSALACLGFALALLAAG